MSFLNNIPGWYRQVVNYLSIQQSEIFLLFGDVQGYPVYPGETLVEFLRRVTLSGFRKAARESAPEGEELSDDVLDRAVAEEHLFVTYAPATGLQMTDAERAIFERYVPQPETNPFAGEGAGGGGPVADFNQLRDYFCSTEAPPMALVIEDADLLFDAESPMVEPERTMVSHIRQWASRPLVAGNGRVHRIYLLAPTQVGIRSALTSGRVATVNIPLPSLEDRERFVEAMEIIAKDEDRELTLEDMSNADLARITGALNLQQIEDVIYQAELEGGVLTREMVQERKDTLVRDMYGSVIEITYPTTGFDSLAGYDDLKSYMVDYVQPLLATGDKLCPKGMVLSGPPGTGKTAFGNALAASVNLPLVIIQTDKIKSKYVGESNKNMAKLAEGIAALAPAVILLDEIDKIMPTSDDNTGVSQEMLGMLQTFLSDIPRGTAFFVATTNYPSRIPRALLRPGRFEEVIPMLPQHMDGLRTELFTRVAATMGVPCEDVDFEQVADKAIDYTGADVERAIIKANRLRVMAKAPQITAEHCLTAIDGLVPTVATAQAMVDEALEYCADKSYIPQSMREVAAKAVETAGKRREVKKDVW